MCKLLKLPIRLGWRIWWYSATITLDGLDVLLACLEEIEATRGTRSDNVYPKEST
jgi:hypothetical protein